MHLCGRMWRSAMRVRPADLTFDFVGRHHETKKKATRVRFAAQTEFKPPYSSPTPSDDDNSWHTGEHIRTYAHMHAAMLAFPTSTSMEHSTQTKTV